MDEGARTRLSRLLSKALRHQPAILGLHLEEGGWVGVDALLEGLRAHSVTRAMLEEVVATSPKARFSFSQDGQRIRANQGHSVEVDLGLDPCIPTALLYHGTFAGALAGIRAEGLRPMGRHHVHLSADPDTARQVGARRGEALVLEVDAARMHEAGHRFYRSANGVWLVDRVPAEFLRFPAPTP